jgi:hypothetical protein
MALQPGALPAQGIDARVRAALDAEGAAWIGQQVVLKIELLTSGLSFSGQRIRLPDVPGALVLEDAVSTVKLSEPVEGETWQVLSYRYPVFAQREGLIDVAPARVTFAVSAGYGSEAVSFDLPTEALSFEVRSPPGVQQPAGLVTTTDFSLDVKVTPEPVDRRVGDAVTRTVTRTATAVSGMAFAPLPAPPVAGVTVYPGSPEVEDTSHRGDLVGKRVESVTYVLQQAGKVTIPGAALQWWNPDTEQLNTETIPALTFAVAANPDLETGPDLFAEALGLAVNRPWVPVVAVACMAVLVWAAFRSLPPAIQRLRRWRTARRRSEGARFRRLLRACRTNDPGRIYNAYLRWITGEGSPGPDAPGAEALARERERLQTALVGREPEWRADAFRGAVKRARRAARGTRRAAGAQVLPALNP